MHYLIITHDAPLPGGTPLRDRGEHIRYKIIIAYGSPIVRKNKVANNIKLFIIICIIYLFMNQECALIIINRGKAQLVYFAHI